MAPRDSGYLGCGILRGARLCGRLEDTDGATGGGDGRVEVKKGQGTESTGQPARRGRRPGRSDTKNLILESARHMFASLGYEQTGIRAIAERAGVDSALVMHYFSSKGGLLQAAMEWPFDMDEATQQVFEGDPGHTGERLVRKVCEMWESEATRHPLTVIVRNAVTREDAAHLTAEWVEQAMVGRLAARTQDPSAPLRAILAHSALVGLVMIRYVVRIEPLASAPVEVVVKTVGPSIQRYLMGDIGGA